jgi:hypothetical protein
MKRLWTALAICFVAGMVVWLKTSHRPQPVSQVASEPGTTATPTTPASITTTEADPPEPAPDASIPEPPGPVLPKRKPVSLAAMEELPVALEAPENATTLPPVTALENMRTTVRQYTLRFGENPVGDNSEITAALNGKNPKQVSFLNPDDGLRVNGQGQLVDHWDTPYFFHQLSRTEMEIQSAGPDRKMWTGDDLVIK